MVWKRFALLHTSFDLHTPEPGLFEGSTHTGVHRSKDHRGFDLITGDFKEW
jgi:hypothetical protein